MNVNYFTKAFRRTQFTLFIGVAAAFCIISSLLAFVSIHSESELVSKRVNIAVRAIGHELLLHAGDSTSVVRPVVEKSVGVFLLEFENEIAFKPDTLVAIVQRSLSKTTLSQYTVTVHECHKPIILYGFEINPPINSSTPCLGRSQPKACYTIEIAFADFPALPNSYKPMAIFLSGISLVLVFFLFGKRKDPSGLNPTIQNHVPVKDENEQQVIIGKFVFEYSNLRLKLKDEIIPLTDKECKILSILNRNIGQLTQREELIKEVWTDEGVITGRSLDMFISKLRKKLSADPGLRIINVHGKGYKLEVVVEN